MQQPEADLLVQAAVAELAVGRVARADALLQDAIRVDPRHPMALATQAEIAVSRKDHARAIALADSALAIEPNCAPAWSQRSQASWLAGRREDALEAARRAMDIQPPNPRFRLLLAQFAAWTGHGTEARQALAPLLAAEQHDRENYAAAVSMMGELAIAEGRFGEADPYLVRALQILPGLEATRMLRGMNQLRLGRFREGWTNYAAREQVAFLYPDGRPVLPGQVWRGEALAEKTLLVVDDQGHGDSIQFFRYLPLLRDLGAAHITWRTFPALARLLADAAPYATVLAALPDEARFDFHCTSTSLPSRFGAEPGNIPAAVPYLRPPARLKSAMKPAAGRGLKVGLAWSGDARHMRDHLRSIPAADFLMLADVRGISFHSLQHEIRPSDLPALEARPAIGREVEKAMDFADTAALIAKLDLVITVDTGVAHLAAALGRPVWIILHVAPDWRWLTGRPDSPWYPSVRLFRVTPEEWLGDAPPRVTAGAWGPVLGRVAAALRTLAAR